MVTCLLAPDMLTLMVWTALARHNLFYYYYFLLVNFTKYQQENARTLEPKSMINADVNQYDLCFDSFG